MGEFEKLVKDIEEELASAEGGWFISRDELVIHQEVTRDPSRRNNGGEYDFYKCYRPDGLGVEVYETWSCDFADLQNTEDRRFDCVIGLDGLERIARLATVTIAARAWLAKEPGCMSKLKAAIRAV